MLCPGSTPHKQETKREERIHLFCLANQSEESRIPLFLPEEVSKASNPSMRPLGAPGFFSLQVELRGPGKDYAKGLPTRTLFLGMFR